MSRIADALKRAAAERKDANASDPPAASETTATFAALVAAAWPEESTRLRPESARAWTASARLSGEDDRFDESRPAPSPHGHRPAGALVEPSAALGPVLEQRVPLAPTEQHLSRYWDMVRRRWRLGAVVGVVVVGGVTS